MFTLTFWFILWNFWKNNFYNQGFFLKKIEPWQHAGQIASILYFQSRKKKCSCKQLIKIIRKVPSRFDSEMVPLSSTIKRVFFVQWMGQIEANRTLYTLSTPTPFGFWTIITELFAICCRWERTLIMFYWK